MLDNPADLISVAVEVLIRLRRELPAFSTLDQLVGRVRAVINRRYFQQVAARVPAANQARNEALLDSIAAAPHAPYHALKQQLGRPSRKHPAALLDHLAWLESLGAVDQFLLDLPEDKRRHFAAECKALDAAELKDVTVPKRLTLILCLIQQARMQTRDDLTEMCIKQIHHIHVQCKAELGFVRERQQETTEHPVDTLAAVLEVVEQE